MAERTIRIYLVEDDHRIILPGLRSRFRISRDGLEFVNSSSTAKEAVQRADPKTFDLFFLDLYIPCSEPEENISMLQANFPDKPIIIFTTEESAFWKSKTSHAGAKAYLTKKDRKDQIKTVIRMVMNGESINYYSHKGDHKENREQLKDSSEKLTTLQRQVIELLCEGENLEEIARETGLTKNTVEKTLGSLRELHGARNNPNLIWILSHKSLI